MASTFLEPIYLSPKEYAFTDSGNIICRNAKVIGAQNIIFNGRSYLGSGCVIRGDLRRLIAAPGGAAGQMVGQATAIGAGKYLSVGEGTILRPPGKIFKGVFNYYPMKIGDFVQIGENCIVEAATIGNGTEIGDDSIIGQFAIIKDFVRIEPGTVLAPNTVCPNMTLWAGNPGRLIDTLPESTPEIVEAEVRANYKRYKVAKPDVKA